MIKQNIAYGSVALLLRNAKCNVSPGLSHFEGCALAGSFKKKLDYYYSWADLEPSSEAVYLAAIFDQ